MDLWVAGEWLTCDDNMAFAPQFRHAVLDTIAQLRSPAGFPPPFAGLSPIAAHRRLMLDAGHDQETEADYELRSRHRVLDWGPTTDNATTHLFRDGDRLMITLQFRRAEHLLRHPEHADKVFLAEIAAPEFVSILEDLVAALDRSHQDHP
ncbi:hypothetical protein [Streptomyces sp. NPDC026092]|uniref:hypothetical protein n=1 Tax=Streptomyces sp. NPDC026092 TaxID=3154797 RepID=UPI0033E06453